MSEKRDIAGLWWLPANPDERWAGTLTLECGEDPKLIVNSQKSALQDLGKELVAPPAIVGHDQNGKLISLLFPSWPRTHGGRALSQIEFEAHYAILGLELSHHDDFKVNELTFQMQHLLAWVESSGFLKNEQTPNEDFIIRYKSPDDQLFVINSDLSIKFYLGFLFNNDRHKKELEEKMRVTFVCKDGIKLSQCKDLMGTFRQLLHFATLKRIYPLEITARKESHGFVHEDKFYPQDIELWNSIIREDVESDSRPDKWIFRFADVQSRFSDFFSNWLKFTNDFEEALNSYSTTIYHSLPSPITHICLTQALEAYHGVKFASHGQTNFCGKIQELAEKYKDHLKGLVDNVPQFAKIVRDNRHYYTHHNPEDLKAGRVVSGTPLFRLNEKLN